MADITLRILVIHDPRWELVHDSRPLTGIMTSFPTLEGNQISSDKQQQQQQQQDSDPYIGVAFGSTYWNKGAVRLLPQYLHLASSIGHSDTSQHTMEGYIAFQNGGQRWLT